MHQTSLSLLQQLREQPEPELWRRLVDLYAPLLRNWLRQYEVQATDVDDLVQDVLMAVSTELPKFDHSGHPGAFRAWLRTTLVNRLRNFWRARGRHPVAGAGSDIERRLDELEDPTNAMTQIWNQQHDQHVLGRLLRVIEPQFAPTTWQAFRRQAIDGEKADAVARDLDLSLNAVFIAKSRVLSRLRQEAKGIIEASSDFSASG